MKKRSLIILLVLCALCVSGCRKQEIELAPVEMPQLDDFDTMKGAYNEEMATGVYSSYIENDVRIMFFGIQPYKLLPEETDRLNEGTKAVVVGLSAYKLRNTDAKIKSGNYLLCDLDSNSVYKASITKDNDITQFESAKEKTVFCYRLIYFIPQETDIDRCVLVAKENDDKAEHVFSHIKADEALDQGNIVNTNLCPICAKEQYEETTLVICECELCGRKFVSDHAPAQKICYACSVMNNYCTQCMRYIVRGIDEKEGK